MVWGILRILIFGSAFLTGVLLSESSRPAVSAGSLNGSGSANLETTGTALVVTCDTGNPTVQGVSGSLGAIQVQCSNSKMRVVQGTLAPYRGHRGRAAMPLATAVSVRQ